MLVRKECFLMMKRIEGEEIEMSEGGGEGTAEEKRVNMLRGEGGSGRLGKGEWERKKNMV